MIISKVCLRRLPKLPPEGAHIISTARQICYQSSSLSRLQKTKRSPTCQRRSPSPCVITSRQCIRFLPPRPARWSLRLISILPQKSSNHSRADVCSRRILCLVLRRVTVDDVCGWTSHGHHPFCRRHVPPVAALHAARSLVSQHGNAWALGSLLRPRRRSTHLLRHHRCRGKPRNMDIPTTLCRCWIRMSFTSLFAFTLLIHLPVLWFRLIRSFLHGSGIYRRRNRKRRRATRKRKGEPFRLMVTELSLKRLMRMSHQSSDVQREWRRYRMKTPSSLFLWLCSCIPLLSPLPFKLRAILRVIIIHRCHRELCHLAPATQVNVFPNRRFLHMKSEMEERGKWLRLQVFLRCTLALPPRCECKVRPYMLPGS